MKGMFNIDEIRVDFYRDDDVILENIQVRQD